MKNLPFIISVALLLVVSSVGAQLPVAGEEYYIEAYATAFQDLRSIAFSPGGQFGFEGQLFAVDAESSSGKIFRVLQAGQKLEFAETTSHATNEHSVLFPPIGASFEGFLYVLEANTIQKYDSQGNRTKFADVSGWTKDIVFSVDESFGDYLYQVDSTQRIRRWNATGSYSNFVYNMPYTGLHTMAFGPGGDFGTDLYVVFTSERSGQKQPTIKTVSPNGAISDFVTFEESVVINQPAFDVTGNFGGSLFVRDWENNVLYAIEPDGTVAQFASGFSFSRVAYRNYETGGIVFGPEGAMYVADGGAGTVWRIAPILGELESIEIQGLEQIAENSSAGYKATAYFSGGTVMDVTSDVLWSVDSDGLSDIDQFGMVSTSEVHVPQRFIVSAEYTYKNVTTAASMDVTVLPTCPGSALRFDGIYDYVRIRTSESLEPTVTTVELWAFIESEQEENPKLISKSWGYSAGKGFKMALVSQDDVFAVYFSNNGSVWVRDDRPGRDYVERWHHFAGVYTPDTMSLYVDGVHVGTKGHSKGIMAHDGSPVNIGFGFGASGYFFKGMIDEVRIWNVARTADEIKQNYQRRLSGDETGLVAYWDFDDGQGQTLSDRSPFGNDGILGNPNPDYASKTTPVWVESTAPVLCANMRQAISQNISDALKIKQRILDDLEKLRAKELATELLLRELRKEGGVDDLSKKEILQIRMNLVIAIIRELQSSRSLADSVEELQEAMAVLSGE